jgi:hypothetical protein
MISAIVCVAILRTLFNNNGEMRVSAFRIYKIATAEYGFWASSYKSVRTIGVANTQKS